MRAGVRGDGWRGTVLSGDVPRRSIVDGLTDGRAGGGPASAEEYGEQRQRPARPWSTGPRAAGRSSFVSFGGDSNEN
jgi:hypothetical protein